MSERLGAERRGQRVGMAPDGRQGLRPVLPRRGADLRACDCRIRAGREGFGDGRLDGGEGERVQGRRSEAGRHLSGEPFQRAAVVQGPVLHEAEPLLGRRLAQEASYAVGRLLAFPLETARHLRELAHPCRIAPRAPPVEWNDIQRERSSCRCGMTARDGLFCPSSTKARRRPAGWSAAGSAAVDRSRCRRGKTVGPTDRSRVAGSRKEYGSRSLGYVKI